MPPSLLTSSSSLILPPSPPHLLLLSHLPLLPLPHLPLLLLHLPLLLPHLPPLLLPRQLVGRFKEIINCGGEKISPLELEDQLLGVAGVETCVCFATPAELLGEVVGVACVVKQGATPPTLDELRAGITTVGHRFKPVVLVYMDAIPKGPTGKPKRIGLAKQLNLPALVEGVAVYEARGSGDKLAPLMHHAKDFWGKVHVVPAWTFPMVMRLEMNPDLDPIERSTHILEIDDAGCNGIQLMVTCYVGEKGEHPLPVEFPITKEHALEAVKDMMLRATEKGLEWEADCPGPESKLSKARSPRSPPISSDLIRSPLNLL